MADTCKIVVMASGNGSNFQALIDGIASGAIPNSKIVRLYVNRGKAFATKRAEKAGIPWEYFNLISNGFQAKGEKDPERLQEARNRYDAALAERLFSREDVEKPDLVVLAGWMYVFGREFLDPLEKRGVRIINLHPALPGAYDGAHAIERAYDDFKAGKLKDDTTGIMVHNVISEVDRGEPILVREIKCRPDEDLQQLETRIHSYEHELIVEATAKVAQEIIAKRKTA